MSIQRSLSSSDSSAPDRVGKPDSGCTQSWGRAGAASISRCPYTHLEIMRSHEFSSLFNENLWILPRQAQHRYGFSMKGCEKPWISMIFQWC